MLRVNDSAIVGSLVATVPKWAEPRIAHEMKGSEPFRSAWWREKPDPRREPYALRGLKLLREERTWTSLCRKDLRILKTNRPTLW